jgi:light-independent protochlorophyllide reductase subunit N
VVARANGLDYCLYPGRGYGAGGHGPTPPTSAEATSPAEKEERHSLQKLLNFGRKGRGGGGGHQLPGPSSPGVVRIGAQPRIVTQISLELKKQGTEGLGAGRRPNARPNCPPLTKATTMLGINPFLSAPPPP